MAGVLLPSILLIRVSVSRVDGFLGVGVLGPFVNEMFVYVFLDPDGIGRVGPM